MEKVTCVYIVKELKQFTIGFADHISLAQSGGKITRHGRPFSIYAANSK